MSNQLDGNESVYPLQHPNDNTFFNDSGITLRQYYAGLAMQGLCANPHVTKIIQREIRNSREQEEILATSAAQIADAVIAELNKTKTP